MPERNETNRYAILLTFAFVTIGTFAITHHEMWRDEIQAWLLARDSTSLTDLFRNLRYEGHQAIWHLLLTPLSRVTASPVIMQAAHLLIAATTVYLTARYSPFNRPQKFLIVFGYFYFYEYALISRNYALGVLLITLFCILFEKRHSRFLPVAIVLVLLSHTNPHCLIIAIIAATVLFLEFIVSKSDYLAGSTVKYAHPGVGFALIATGICTAILQLIPPADSGYAVGWHLDFDPDRLKQVVNIVTNAYFPVPVPALHFWGTNWLRQSYTFSSFQTGISLVLLAGLSLTLLRRPVALAVFIAGTTALLSFFYIKFFGSIRHHGFLFILFLMAIWIQRTSGPEVLASGMQRRLSATGKYAGSLQQYMLTGILCFQFAGGAIAVTMDIRHVFSHGKAAAEYISSNGMQDLILVGDLDAPVSTIVAYLEKDSAYYLRANRTGSFVVWDKARLVRVPDEEAIKKAVELADQHRENVLLVLNRELDQAAPGSLCMLASFTGAIVKDEDFYLYLVRQQHTKGTQQPVETCNTG